MKMNKLLLILLSLAGILAVYFLLPTPVSTDMSKPMEKVLTQKDLERFTTRYYLDSRVDLVSSALSFIDGNSIMVNRRAQAPLIAFFNRVFKDNPLKKDEWTLLLRTLKVPVRVAFLKSMNLTEEELLKEQPLSPMKNDMYWAYFFASGDIKYVAQIVDFLKYYDQDTDVKAFLTAGEAKVSLAINARKHATVLNYLKEITNDPSSAYYNSIKEVLTMKPTDIHARVLDKANKNKEKGIW